jgi:arsenate reductase
MAERGIDITDEYPKPWTDEIVRAADVFDELDVPAAR